MGDDTPETAHGSPAGSTDVAASPGRVVRSVVRSGWNTLLTVYWANSASWRFLKAGALVFFGFFLWAASNVLLSYRPDWWLLRYVAAYGFVVTVYGPVHHLVVIPLALRWRRGEDVRRRVGRRLPNGMLTAFLAVVVVLGTFPVGPTTVDLASALDDSGVDVNPDLLCVKSGSGDGVSVHCHLTESEGIDRVVVESGGEVVATDEQPPFEFTVAGGDLVAVDDRKRFSVDLLDADGELLRRYTRTLAMIEEA